MPFRGPPKHVVENLKHVVVVPNLRRSSGVGLIRRLVWDLIPHLREVHVDSRVVLDHLFKLAQDGDEVSLSMLIDVVDRPTQPLPMDAVVGRQPATRPGGGFVSILNSTQRTSSGLLHASSPVDPVLSRDLGVIAMLVNHFAWQIEKCRLNGRGGCGKQRRQAPTRCWCVSCISVFQRDALTQGSHAGAGDSRVLMLSSWGAS